MRALVAVVLLALSGCAANPSPDAIAGVTQPRATLHVITSPEGATVSAVYGYSAAAQRSISCIAPCDLSLPLDSTFQVHAEKTGYHIVSAPPVRWALVGNALVPGSITIEMQPD